MSLTPESTVGWPWRWLVVISALSLALTGCSSIFPKPLDPVVKIGLVAPFEGRYRDIGYDVIYSARLAIREANERSGPGQTKFAVVAVDDFGDPEIAQKTAEAMVTDPDIVAVLGHWSPATTAAARTIYVAEGLPFIEAGEGMLGATDPTSLDQDFLRAYEDVTPYDQAAGPFAGTAYDGMHFILAALYEIEQNNGEINRASMSRALLRVNYEGITGPIRMN